jgi:hypothetical protein
MAQRVKIAPGRSATVQPELLATTFKMLEK